MPQFSIEEFCKYCDHGPLGLNNCHLQRETYGPHRDQERYARRGFCGWANLEGVSISIRNHDPEYNGTIDLCIEIPRSPNTEANPISVKDIDSIKKSLEEAKTKGAPINRKVPFPSVLERLQQEAVA